jgi:uncharacterized protein YycO
LSKFFLNWFGNVQISKHPLFLLLGDTHYKIKGPQQRQILDKVESGDILLRRYDKYLSGLGIPGYYTHSGLCVDDGRVIHAVGGGIVEEDILTFSRCDGIAILRPKIEVSRLAQHGAVQKAKSLIGTKYDWLFDFDDDRYYSCTEMVYECYKDYRSETGIKVRGEDEFPANSIIPDDFLNFDLDLIYEFKA